MALAPQHLESTRSLGYLMRALRSFVLSGVVTTAIALIAACGGSAPPAAAPASPAASSSGSSAAIAPTSAEAPVAAAVPVEVGPRESISRSMVLAGIKGGLGRFLAYVEVEPVLEAKSGKRAFVGWRVVKLRGPAGTWDGYDVKVGDVVTRVNGFKIERDFQADAAFRSLAIASEIRVSIVRDGRPTEIRFSIADEAPTTASSDAPRTTTAH